MCGTIRDGKPAGALSVRALSAVSGYWRSESLLIALIFNKMLSVFFFIGVSLTWNEDFVLVSLTEVSLFKADFFFFFYGKIFQQKMFSTKSKFLSFPYASTGSLCSKPVTLLFHPLILTITNIRKMSSFIISQNYFSITDPMWIRIIWSFLLVFIFFLLIPLTFAERSQCHSKYLW